MSDFDRRQFLKGILGNLAQAAGSVVVASAAVSLARAQEPSTEDAPADVQVRADRLAADDTCGLNAAAANEFRNGAFRNTPIGAFRNTPLGGFRNTPLGGFRNTPLGGFHNAPLGGFRNTPLGAFGNSPLNVFGNGGWPNGGWGGFGNGGWPNMGWLNW